MSGLNVKGTLIQVLKSESGVGKNGKDWNKQDFVIETNEQFPKKVCFTLFGDKTSLIDGISEGSEIDVHFNLESRDFNGKWYHNINAWKIEKSTSSTEDSSFTQPSPSTGLSIKEQILAKQAAQPIDDTDDQLPF